MNIKILSVPQDKIRSNQIGDWWYFGNGNCLIHVLESLSLEAQLAVAVHELVEAVRCSHHRVSDDAVCRFDDQYEAERKKGQHGEDDEPGDDPRSPYRAEHQDATFVERALCHVIGISWPTLEPLVLRLEEAPPRRPSLEPLLSLSSEPPPKHVLD